MAAIIENIYGVFIPKTDPRLENYFFAKSIVQPVSVSIIYYVFVRYIGPKLMENTKPYKLKNTLIIYNAFQVVLSAYMCYEAFGYWNGNNFSWFKCASADLSRTPLAYKGLNCIYIYHVSKYTEMLDTIFFILRKKYNQITFHHVYHHGSMPLYSYLAFAVPGGSMIVAVLLNTFVHVFMYGYYMLAAVGPQMQKYLWWKKYLTSIQLIQCIAGLIHFVIVCFDDCNIPKIIGYIFTFNIISNFVLFIIFYNKSYRKPTEATNNSIPNKGKDTILEGKSVKENVKVK